MNQSAEAIIDQIIRNVSSIPMTIRVFLKVLYEESMRKWGDKIESYRLISGFLIDKWFSDVCFKDLHLHGLTKNFRLGHRCLYNLELLSILVDKTFKMDNSWEFHSTYFKEFNQLFNEKQKKI